MKYTSLLIVALISGCTGSPIMTSHEFAEIEVGTETKVLEKQFGVPVSVITTKDGKKVYEYVEKINIGGQTVEMRNYYFLIEDGMIAKKKFNSTVRPPFDNIQKEDVFSDKNDI